MLKYWKITVVLVVITSGYFQTSAQKADSLRTLLKTDIHDTIRGKVYLKLADFFSNREVDLAATYIDSAMMIDAYMELPSQTKTLTYMRGVVAERRQLFDSAIVFFNKILRDNDALLSDSLMVAKTNYKMGNMHRRMDQNEKAIGYLNTSKELYFGLGLPDRAADSDVVLGIIYKNSGQLEKAIEYYTSAYEEYKKINYYDAMSTCLLNIANVYGRQGNYKAALSKYDEAYEVAQNVENNEGLLAYIYGNRGNAHTQLNQPQEAYKNNLLAYELRKEKAAPLERATGLIGLATSLKDLNRPKEALIKIEEAKAIAETTEGMLEVKERIYKTLFLLYNKEKQSSKAIDAVTKLLEYKDSVRHAASDKTVLELNEKFETESKEKEILLLNTEKELAATKLASARRQTYGLLVGLLIFGGLLFNTFRLYRKTQFQNGIISKALSEKEILLREIHHRVKNNLQFISSLLGLQTEHVEDEAALGALQGGQDRVQSMALIHQNLYQEDNLTGVDMKDYFIKLIRGLFDSYNIRKDQVALELEIEDLNLDVDSVIPIGLIVNELVSNSLKYAFPDKRKGIIKVGLHERDENGKKVLVVDVTDDGVGMSNEIKEELGKSFGYRLVNVFKDQLNAELDIDGSNGTKVSMSIRKYEKTVEE